MNAIAFGTKRTFHGFLRLTRRAFASLGLTAARFDMMQAIDTTPRNRFAEIRQNMVRRALGVTAGVVSRMVRALEQLRYVKRTRCPHDRRTFCLEVTKSGWARLSAARAMLLRSLQRFVFMAICFGKHEDRKERVRRMAALEQYLDVLRDHLGDTARLSYPWPRPDG